MIEFNAKYKELPYNWTWTELDSIAQRINPGFPSGRHNKEKQGVPHIRPMNISPIGDLDLSNIKYVEVTDYERLLKGDILFNNTNSPEMLGKTTYINQDTNWAYSNHMTRIRLYPQLEEPAWIAFYLHYLFLKGFYKMNCVHHVNQASINSGFLSKKIPIPLAPFSEQKRIVGMIEELFSRLDAGVEALRRARAQLQRYRQSVLQAAVTGRLTAEWRAAHPEVEPAVKLVNEIGDRTFNGGDSRSLSLDVSGLPELPDSWIWTSLGKITNLTSGKAFKKDEYSKDGVRLFQIANVSFGKIIWDNLVYMPQDYLRIFPNLSLNPGDILMALNRPILDGRLKIGCLGEQDIPSILYQRVGRFDFYDNSIAPYFFFFAQSPNFINMLKDSLQGVDQPFINKPRLLNLPIALPPKQEQCQIVSEIERHISVAEKIEDAIEVNLKNVSFLRQSILQRAFQGKLVPQDPSDEPASLLLERIRAERIKESPRRGRKNNILQARLDQ